MKIKIKSSILIKQILGNNFQIIVLLLFEFGQIEFKNLLRKIKQLNFHV